MDYCSIYVRLCERAKERALTGYKELHHSMPKCLGGSDDSIIPMTAREHFIAHQLLAKIFPRHSGLVYAAYMMSRKRKYTNGRIYEWLRMASIADTKRRPSPRLGTTHSPETRLKMSLAAKGRKAWNLGFCHLTDDARKSIGDKNKSKQTGKIITDEHRANIIKGKLGKPMSDEHKEACRRAALNRVKAPA